MKAHAGLQVQLYLHGLTIDDVEGTTLDIGIQIKPSGMALFQQFGILKAVQGELQRVVIFPQGADQVADLIA